MTPKSVYGARINLSKIKDHIQYFVVREPMNRQGFRMRNSRGSNGTILDDESDQEEKVRNFVHRIRHIENFISFGSPTKPIAGSQKSLLPNDQPDYVNSQGGEKRLSYISYVSEAKCTAVPSLSSVQ